MLTSQDRRSYNLQILNTLYKIVDSYPDLRFGQIVESFCKDYDSDFFYDEPDKTLQILQKRLEYGH